LTGMSVVEFALLKLFLQKRQKISAKQFRALLCVLARNETYLSPEEIGKGRVVSENELQKILRQFTKERLFEREGCLYKRLEGERIAEAIGRK